MFEDICGKMVITTLESPILKEAFWHEREEIHCSRSPPTLWENQTKENEPILTERR